MVTFIIGCFISLSLSVKATSFILPNVTNNAFSLVTSELTPELIPPKRESSTMIDFTDQKEVNNWRITNDDVMGGVSKGFIKAKEEQGLFNGSISLKNNGGFSSVFRKIKPLSPDFDSVVIDIKGDGLTYQLRMVVNVEGYRLAYKYPFKTIAGQREQLIFTLTDFQASFRGRAISNAPLLNAKDIQEVGFLVTNKEESNFALSIMSLIFVKEQHNE